MYARTGLSICRALTSKKSSFRCQVLLGMYVHAWAQIGGGEKNLCMTYWQYPFCQKATYSAYWNCPGIKLVLKILNSALKKNSFIKIRYVWVFKTLWGCLKWSFSSGTSVTCEISEGVEYVWGGKEIGCADVSEWANEYVSMHDWAISFRFHTSR